jgi:hypothetical protein
LGQFHTMVYFTITIEHKMISVVNMIEHEMVSVVNMIEQKIQILCINKQWKSLWTKHMLIQCKYFSLNNMTTERWILKGVIDQISY